MRIAKKKVFTSIMACIMICLMFSMPVLAASSSFSKTTAKINAINGLTATKTFTGTATGTDPKITQVKVYLNVSSGSDPFKFYLVSPSGTEYEMTPSTTSNTYYVSAFNGETPKGTWYVSVENLGITYNPIQIYPTTTVTPTITVTYSY